MTIGRTAGRLAGWGTLVMALAVGPATAQRLQKRTSAVSSPNQAQQFVNVPEPDAQRTKNEFERLLSRYPPTVRGVFRQDPTLMTQQDYLTPYPALANFLNDHPEIALNPAFYLDGLGDDSGRYRVQRQVNWDDVLKAMFVFSGFAMAIGLLTWLIRTFLDYRRWNRLSKVQTEVHTRLLDRFSTNEELMAYIATPAGSKFLQSAPISVDMGTNLRSVGAPVNRIMWSLQAGLVLAAAGAGLMLASGRLGEDSYLPLEIMGILAVALGVGFAVSAAVSYVLSQKLGLLDPVAQRRPAEQTAERMEGQ